MQGAFDDFAGVGPFHPELPATALHAPPVEQALDAVTLVNSLSGR